MNGTNSSAKHYDMVVIGSGAAGQHDLRSNSCIGSHWSKGVGQRGWPRSMSGTRMRLKSRLTVAKTPHQADSREYPDPRTRGG
jgi:hypothetical protein